MSRSPSSAPLPVVLDTNVVLDMLVFDDPTVQPLVSALTAGTVMAWADEATLLELELVLAYPSFALDKAAQHAARARYRGLVRVAPDEPGTPPPPLPRCRDRDDQKFLTLAARVGASWLVSKDKRVLALAGHKDVPFDILKPRQLAERLRQLAR